MNFDQLRKNTGAHVQLEPPACRLDANGFEVPRRNDDWRIDYVGQDGVRLTNVATDHVATLGLDHIHHFTTNPARSKGTERYGFLTLTVQLFMQGRSLEMRPTTRPGEQLAPHPVHVAEKLVDIRYPADTGLQARLEAQGYRVAWCFETQLSRKLDLEGWEVVLERDRAGVLQRFRLRDRPHDQVLIKQPAIASLTGEEWSALKGISAATALGTATARNPVASQRLVRLGLVHLDANGYLALTAAGREALDRHL